VPARKTYILGDFDASLRTGRRDLLNILLFLTNNFTFLKNFYLDVKLFTYFCVFASGGQGVKREYGKLRR
jgi:hypothetical protein